MVSTILNRGQIHSNVKELLASTYADMIAVSTAQLAPGSKCLCLDSFVEYILSPEKTWVEIPAQGNGGNIVVPDLDGYATTEYVDERIALLLNNESVDLDSIAELVKVLEEGGADLVEIRETIEEIIKVLAEKCSIKAFEEFKAHVLSKEQELSQAIADETERAIAAELELQKEVSMANMLGSRGDDTYKVKRTDKGLELSLSNVEEEKLNKIVIGEDDISIEQRKQVLNPPTYPAGGQVSTIITDPEYSFANVDELREDINSGGAKAQKLFNAGVLASGREYRECNEVPRPSGTGIKLMLDNFGNGYVDCENGAVDVTYDPNTLKIFRLGDYYMYIVYDENNFPIGACRFGRPEGVFPEGNANHHADWGFTELGAGIDKDVDTSKQPNSKIKFNGLDKEFVATKAWGSEAHVYKLVQVGERYIIIYSRKGAAFYQPAYNKEGIFCPKITNYEFDIQTDARSTDTITHYVLSEDYYAITVKEDVTNSPSNVLSAFNLFDVLAGKGPFVSNTDVGALPANSMNLWGGYWPEKDDYRVGTFDPDVESYEYDVNSGVNTARKLNPAGNYNVYKLESFHPLRMEDGSELKIRTAMIKGFKTSMDWPNASAVIPSDCALKSGNMWIQVIYAHTVESKELRMFYRVLYDGYVKNKENVRYPWSPCAEIVTTKDLDVIKADFEAKYNELNNKYNELNDKYNELNDKNNELQGTIGQIQDELGKFNYLPYLSAADKLVLERQSASSLTYSGITYGKYTPTDATITFDVVVTDYTIGDGGQFYYVSDSRATDGSYEATIVNTPGAAGTPHPSALRITLESGDVTIEKLIPIVTE